MDSYSNSLIKRAILSRVLLAIAISFFLAAIAVFIAPPTEGMIFKAGRHGLVIATEAGRLRLVGIATGNGSIEKIYFPHGDLRIVSFDLGWTFTWINPIRRREWSDLWFDAIDMSFRSHRCTVKIFYIPAWLLALPTIPLIIWRKRRLLHANRGFEIHTLR